MWITTLPPVIKALFAKKKKKPAETKKEKTESPPKRLVSVISQPNLFGDLKKDKQESSYKGVANNKSIKLQEETILT